ncbi:hypothetical protein ACPUER_16380 [Burkholderia sp. DN3021]|uniref:hypothetical protein n=1 Tax=Burkholderia TaxID=32008 RepID=UPI00158C595E|nr:MULTISPECIES: hypothetical protein [Burkholderia cepacia complex]MDR6501757.1 hypothetical protein [Burkholderia ambifaria]
MQTTLIDELVNFKEGFSPALIEIRRASNGGADERGRDAAARRVLAMECREWLRQRRLRGNGRGIRRRGYGEGKEMRRQAVENLLGTGGKAVREAGARP